MFLSCQFIYFALLDVQRRDFSKPVEVEQRTSKTNFTCFVFSVISNRFVFLLTVSVFFVCKS